MLILSQKTPKFFTDISFWLFTTEFNLCFYVNNIFNLIIFIIIYCAYKIIFVSL